MMRTLPLFALLLVGCVGGAETAPAPAPASSASAREDAPAASAAKSPSTTAPCQYDAPPPANPPECPKTWTEACHSGSSTFTCPTGKISCWYANVGDETAPGCYAHGLMSCNEWPSDDGGTRLEARCAQ